jgi:hypothetical protein
MVTSGIHFYHPQLLLARFIEYYRNFCQFSVSIFVGGQHVDANFEGAFVSDCQRQWVKTDVKPDSTLAASYDRRTPSPTDGWRCVPISCTPLVSSLWRTLEPIDWVTRTTTLLLHGSDPNEILPWFPASHHTAGPISILAAIHCLNSTYVLPGVTGNMNSMLSVAAASAAATLRIHLGDANFTQTKKSFRNCQSTWEGILFIFQSSIMSHMKRRTSMVESLTKETFLPKDLLSIVVHYIMW